LCSLEIVVSLSKAKSRAIPLQAVVKLYKVPSADWVLLGWAGRTSQRKNTFLSSPLSLVQQTSRGVLHGVQTRGNNNPSSETCPSKPHHNTIKNLTCTPQAKVKK